MVDAPSSPTSPKVRGPAERPGKGRGGVEDPCHHRFDSLSILAISDIRGLTIRSDRKILHHSLNWLIFENQIHATCTCTEGQTTSGAARPTWWAPTRRGRPARRRRGGLAERGVGVRDVRAELRAELRRVARGAPAMSSTIIARFDDL